MSTFARVICLFGILLQITNAQHGSGGKCPNPQVQPEFQLAQYLGIWYEIARFDAIFEVGLECNTANYTTLPSGNIRVVNTGLQTSSRQISQSVGEAMISDPFVGAKITVKFGEQGFSSEPNYWVLSTDYTSYSLVYACRQLTELFHFEFAWILSRTPTISSDLQEGLLSKFESAGISTKPFHFTPQAGRANCTYV